MPTDTYVFRAGMETWITKHDLSFSIDYAGDREYDLAEWRARIRALLSKNNYSELYSDDHVRIKTFHNVFEAPYWDAFTKVAGIWWNHEKQFLNHYAHEGTFYPRFILQDFIQRLKASGLWDVLPGIGWPGEKGGYKVSWPEEIWIPSFLMKNYKSYLTRTDFVPPLAVRFEMRCKTCFSSPSRTVRLLHNDVSWSSAATSIFALKLNNPNLQFEVSALFASRCRRATLTTTTPTTPTTTTTTSTSSQTNETTNSSTTITNSIDKSVNSSKTASQVARPPPFFQENGYRDCCSSSQLRRFVDTDRFAKEGYLRNVELDPLSELARLPQNQEGCPWKPSLNH